MVSGFCSLVSLIGILIAAGWVGDDLLVFERFALAAICLFAALCSMVQFLRRNRRVRIDISSTGQIRLAEVAVVETANTSIQIPRVANLLCGTILWSHLLLLRLQLDDGRGRTIAILPDCVPSDTFRVLSVACRWIALRVNKMDSEGFGNE